MRVTYDPAADALYIYVRTARWPRRARWRRTSISTLAQRARSSDIEILGASARPGSNPMAIAFEILGRELAA